ncbi:MAG: hypothetical protein AAF514_01665 [Verrucomicrobiota bacterium]
MFRYLKLTISVLAVISALVVLSKLRKEKDRGATSPAPTAPIPVVAGWSPGAMIGKEASAEAPGRSEPSRASVEAIFENRDLTGPVVAEKILALLPRLDPDFQLEALDRAQPLMMEPQFLESLALLEDEALNQEGRELLWASLATRPIEWRLKGYLAVAMQEGAYQREALNLLHNRYGADFGNDWDELRSRIRDELEGRQDG